MAAAATTTSNSTGTSPRVANMTTTPRTTSSSSSNPPATTVTTHTTSPSSPAADLLDEADPPAAATTNEEDENMENANNGNDEVTVSCHVESVRVLSTLLSCLVLPQHEKEQQQVALQPVTIVIGNNAGSNNNVMTFHVLSSTQQTQASVEFHSYTTTTNTTSNNGQGDAQPNQNQNVSFCLNLTTLLDCLHVMGGAAALLERTSLDLSFDGTEEICTVELTQHLGGGRHFSEQDGQEGGIRSTAMIPALSSAYSLTNAETTSSSSLSTLAVAFNASPIVARLIIQTWCLRDIVLNELEAVPGATIGTVCMMGNSSNGAGDSRVQFATLGHVSECVVSIPTGYGSHVVAPLKLDPPSEGSTRRHKNRTPAYSYPLSSLLSSLKGPPPLEELGEKHHQPPPGETCLTLNAAGMLAIQHNVEVRNHRRPGPSTSNYVDFILCCLVDEDDEEEDEQATVSDEDNVSTGRFSQPSMDGAADPSPTPDSPSRVWSQNEPVPRRRQPAVSGPTQASAATTQQHQNTRRQDTSRAAARTDNQDGDDEKSDDEEEDEQKVEDESAPPAAAAPLLFGNVLQTTENSNFYDPSIAERSRAVRPRRGHAEDANQSRNNSRRHRHRDDDDSSTSTRTSNCTTQDEGEPETEPLDVTALASPPTERRHPRSRARRGGRGRSGRHGQQEDRDGECSSPELVYGRQH